MDEAADNYLTSVFYVVREYRRGTLPKRITSDPEFMEWVRGMANQLPIEKETKIESVSVTLPRELIDEFWNKRNKVANFLKHADRDSRASISLDEVDNLLLLMQCYNAYMDITRDNLGNEGFILRMYERASREDQSAPAAHQDELVQKLAGMEETERLRFCSISLADLNKRWPAGATG